MTRQLREASGDAFAPALRAALAADGPAVFAGVAESGLPAEVPQRVALVVQSSGSTARPKRVALSADALLASAAASEAVLGGPGQWLLALPQTYIAGIGVLVRSFAAGTDPVVMDPAGFTAARFIEAAALLDGKLRFTSLVPAQLIRLLDEPAAHEALRRFDRVLVGGQATPPPLLARAADAGVRLTRTYGSSETAGGCVYDGVPIGTTRLRVTDGQIEISGPTLAEGYLLDPSRTDAAFITDGTERWFRTGDLGSIDDGVLSVSGRLDDMIVSGGVNVSLGEVERLVRSMHPDAVVVPASDERWGQVPVVVTTREVDLAELRSAAIAQLGAAAAPARVVVVDSIPMLSSGKPDRLALRAAVGG